jgi:hypothetical protein
MQAYTSLHNCVVAAAVEYMVLFTMHKPHALLG